MLLVSSPFLSSPRWIPCSPRVRRPPGGLALQQPALKDHLAVFSFTHKQFPQHRLNLLLFFFATVHAFVVASFRLARFFPLLTVSTPCTPWPLPARRRTPWWWSTATTALTSATTATGSSALCTSPRCARLSGCACRPRCALAVGVCAGGCVYVCCCCCCWCRFYPVPLSTPTLLHILTRGLRFSPRDLGRARLLVVRIWPV
jgi:hypothetical protein